MVIVCICNLHYNLPLFQQTMYIYFSSSFVFSLYCDYFKCIYHVIVIITAHSKAVRSVVIDSTNNEVFSASCDPYIKVCVCSC